MFQFHKVRLKDRIHAWPGNRNIPFQFHKVRLKVTYDMCKGEQIEFQFHKVRLKEKVL